MALFLSILLVLAVTWFLLKPLSITNFDLSRSEAANNAEAAQDRAERTGEMLKDLELDFNTGKLSAHDYKQMKKKLSDEMEQLSTELP